VGKACGNNQPPAEVVVGDGEAIGFCEARTPRAGFNRRDTQRMGLYPISAAQIVSMLDHRQSVVAEIVKAQQHAHANLGNACGDDTVPKVQAGTRSSALGSQENASVEMG